MSVTMNRLRPFDLLACVKPSGGNGDDAHGLRVDQSRARFDAAAVGHSDLAAQRVVQPLHGPVIVPPREVPVHGRPGRKVLRQLTPGTPGPHNIERRASPPCCGQPAGRVSAEWPACVIRLRNASRLGRDVEPECRRGVALASGTALWARRKCNCPRPEDTPGYVRARVRHHSWPHPWHGTSPVKTLGRNYLRGLPYAKRQG